MLGSNCELVRAVLVALELIVGKGDVGSLVSGKSVECGKYRDCRIVVVVDVVPVIVGSSLVVVP